MIDAHGLAERGVAVEPLREGPGVRFFGLHDVDDDRLEACQVLAQAPNGRAGNPHAPFTHS